VKFTNKLNKEGIEELEMKIYYNVLELKKEKVREDY